MGDDCKDCLQVKNLDDKIKAIWDTINEIKNINKELGNRTASLERLSDVTEEKLDRIFTAIGSMEKNIEKIATAIEKIQNKSSRTYDSLKYEIVKYIVLAVTAIVVAKMI
jgi:septal ring factor EnvC (AmiA/AmiB activator)